MTKQSLFLIINAVLMVVIGVAIAFAINMEVLQDPQDLLFNEKVELTLKSNIEDPETNSYQIIDYKEVAKDKDGNTVGTVYNVKIKNGFALSSTDLDYGYIELLVGIKDDELYVAIVDLQQSITYVANIQKYIYENYEGVTYQEVLNTPDFNAAPDADASSGATASTSTSTIREMMIKVFEYHKGIVSDPYEEVLGAGYSFVNDDTFVANDTVTARDNVYNASEELIATRYIASGTNEFGSVEIAVTIDATGIVLYAEYTVLDQTLNLDKSRENLALYIGSSILDLTRSGDIQSGASHTLALTDDLLASILTEWEGAN